MGKQPIWDDDGQTIERVTQHRPNTFQAIERADGGQHVGGVAALSAARPQQALRTELGQQGVEEQVFGVTLNQTCAKLAEY